MKWAPCENAFRISKIYYCHLVFVIQEKCYTGPGNRVPISTTRDLGLQYHHMGLGVRNRLGENHDLRTQNVQVGPGIRDP